MPASSIRASVLILADLLPVQPPADVFQEDMEDGSDTWAPVPNMGDPDGVAQFWL